MTKMAILRNLQLKTEIAQAFSRSNIVA